MNKQIEGGREEYRENTKPNIFPIDRGRLVL